MAGGGLQKVGTQLVAEGADKYVQDLGKSASETTKFEDTLKKLGKAAVAYVGLNALVDLGRQALGTVGAYEALQMSVTSLVSKELRAADATLTMEGALEKASGRAEELLGWIQELAIKSPFDQEGVAQAFRTALAYNFTSQEAQRLTTATIDFATATGQSVGVMNQVSLALGQIKAKGKLAGQEMLQLVNAGFSVNPILEKLGFTMDDVSKGLVTADVFLNAFVSTMEEDFGGAAGRSAETVNGLLNSLGDLKAIGLREFFSPVFQELLPHLSAFVTKLQEGIPVLAFIGRGVASFTGYLIENKSAVVAATVGLAAFVTVLNFGTLLSIITRGIGALTAALGILLSPIGILGIALGGIAAGLYALFSSSRKAQEGLAATGQTMDMAYASAAGLQEPAEKSESWGYNLIINFANGMAKAIGAVLDVLTQLGNAIAGWLAPGSPPKLLPDIDDWGSGAMEAYLSGFASADFSIFNEIGGTIERLMRGLSGPDNVGLIPSIMGSRTEIAAATDELKRTGQVSEETIQRVVNSAGKAGTAVEGYVRAMFAAVNASEAVRQAQEALNNVTEQYDALLAPLNAELKGIHDRRQAIIDEQRTAELQAIIADENAPALAKELAMMELREIELHNQIAATEEQKDTAVDAAEANLDAAQTAEAAAQEQLAVQQALIDAQIEQNSLIQEQISLLERLNEATAGGGGGGAGGAIPSIGEGLGLGGIGEGVGGALDGITERLSQFAEDVKAPFAEIKEQFDAFKLAWAGAGLAFITKLQPMTTALNAAWGEGGTWSGNWQNLKTILDELGLNWQTLLQPGGLMELALAAGTRFVEEKFGPGGDWEGWFSGFTEKLDEWGINWQDLFSPGGLIQIAADFGSGLVEDYFGPGGDWEKWLANVTGNITTFIENGIDALKTGLEGLVTPIQNFIGWIGDLGTAVANLDLAGIWALLGQSPSPFESSLYRINDALHTVANSGFPVLQHSMNQTAVNLPVSQAQVGAASIANSRTENNFNMGGNNISNGMDMAMFEAAVLRVVEGALS